MTNSNRPAAVSRRNVVKAFALACAWSQIADFKWAGRFVVEANAEDTLYPIGTFNLTISDFPALQTIDGSVYLDVPGVPTIIVTRADEITFFAVTSVCTHQGCKVSLFNSVSGVLPCPCHGSQFSADGTVVTGPAIRPLLRYDTHFDGEDILTIALVKIGFPVQGTLVPVDNGGAPRQSITVDTTTGARYQLLFKSTLASSTWKIVSFSQTPTGPVNSTLFIGNGKPATFYIDINRGVQSGFYLVQHS